MSLTLERVGLDDARWTRLVVTRPEATIFHRAEWASLLGATYGFKAFAILGSDRGLAVAGAPFLTVGRPFRRRWSSLPFTDHCAPLGETPAVGEFASALPAFAARDGIASLELRAPTADARDVVTAGVRHSLALERDAPATLRRMASAHLRNARRAEREGVSVAFGHGPDDLRDFYQLHVRTRRRLGVPVQPERFFVELHRTLLRPGHGFFASARHEGRPVASALFLRSGATLVYKYGASDERRWSLRPNDLLFREVITLACHEGYRSLDFGRSDLDDVGLRRFKSELGGTEEPLLYTRSGPWPEVRLAGRLLGPVIRHSWPIVCRAIGNALYRYSA